MKNISILVLISIFFFAESSKGQFFINNLDQDYIIDFDNTYGGVNNGSFAGTGFASSPVPGQLNASTWEVKGTSLGDKPFDEENTTGVFAMGTASGDVTDPGIYAFEVETGNMALGIQASDNDFAPGSIVIKIRNNTGTASQGIKLSFDGWFYNNQNSSTTIKGEFSPNNVHWIPVPGLEASTPLTADASPTWQKVSFDITEDLTINSNGTVFFRWYFEDNAGSGEKDQLAIDNFSVMLFEDLPCIPIDLTDFPNNTYTETFEDDSDYLHCWTQEFVTGDKEWTFQTGAGGGVITQAYEGSKNARFTSTPGGPFTTKLISPVYDLSEINNPVLRFWYGQEEFNANQNQLLVYYRTAPSNNWFYLNTYNQNTNEWTFESGLSLPNQSGTYQIAFEGLDNNGRANVLDNVSILSADDLPVIDEVDVYDDVQEITLCVGETNVNVPIGMLVSEIIINDTHGIESTVSLSWSIPDYNGNVSGNYTAIGTFELPPNVEQSSPATTLEVETIVNVIDLPELNCPDELVLSTEGEYFLSGTVTPTGGTYYFEGNIITSFTPENYENGTYTILYYYSAPDNDCENTCQFDILVQLPSVIDQVDVYNEVQDIEVCLGTHPDLVTPQLVQSITISDDEGELYEVDLGWNIQGYNATFPGEYTAYGVFNLPPTVAQTDPITPTYVTAIVNVLENPGISCPPNSVVLANQDPFQLTGGQPAGGVYTINDIEYVVFHPGMMGIGSHDVTYTYTDPTTGCSNSCSFLITVTFSSDLEILENNKIQIYPNPNNGSFTINKKDINTDLNYQIVDIKGSVLKSNKIYKSENKTNIDLDIAPGIYFLKINGENINSVNKIIVKH